MTKGKKECPLCRNAITPQPMNRIVKKFLDETVLKGCPVEGCQMNASDITYDKLHAHLSRDCSNFPVTCTVGGCNTTYPRAKWQEHFAQCDKITVVCQQCGLGGIPRPIMASN